MSAYLVTASVCSFRRLDRIASPAGIVVGGGLSIRLKVGLRQSAFLWGLHVGHSSTEEERKQFFRQIWDAFLGPGGIELKTTYLAFAAKLESAKNSEAALLGCRKLALEFLLMVLVPPRHAATA